MPINGSEDTPHSVCNLKRPLLLYSATAPVARVTTKPTCPDCGTPLPNGIFGDSCPRSELDSALNVNEDEPPEPQTLKIERQTLNLEQASDPVQSSKPFAGI